MGQTSRHFPPRSTFGSRPPLSKSRNNLHCPCCVAAAVPFVRELRWALLPPFAALLRLRAVHPCGRTTPKLAASGRRGRAGVPPARPGANLRAPSRCRCNKAQDVPAIAACWECRGAVLLRPCRWCRSLSVWHFRGQCRWNLGARTVWYVCAPQLQHVTGATVPDRDGRPPHLAGSGTKSTPSARHARLARPMAASRWQHSTATPCGGRGSGASLDVNMRSWSSWTAPAQPAQWFHDSH